MKNGELTNEGMQYLLNRTKFQRDDIVDWYTEYHKLRPSGCMNEQSFVWLCKQVERVDNGTLRAMQILIDSLSTNGRLKADFVQALDRIDQWHRGSEADKISLLFDCMDNNSNGYIGKHALKAGTNTICKALGIHDSISSLEIAISLIQNSDHDGDDRLSRSEFINACLKSPQMRQIFSPIVNI
ncbi:hypothetical protein GJ496_004460 [Pomphorhynchus laevis]|nr:hypothetical protein GJ496_004460 [Pomphorhynchus laevis]